MAGIYLHIPFCKQACHYCDFHFSTSLKYKDEMMKAIHAELQLQKHYLSGEIIETIYFGGGTPSLLIGEEIESLVDHIADLFSLSADAEITLEANPDDLHLQNIRKLRTTHVNRFSIGVQSFFQEDLRWMNRAHTANEAEGSVKRLQDAGFENITLDLIYGYPFLTDEKLKANIQKVKDLLIPHISAYSMTVEPKTALASLIRKGLQQPMNESQSAEQFLIMLDSLTEAGFEQYEISNFARDGKYSKHNSNYWKGVSYLGIGPSAHSFNGKNRQWNIANNAKYMESIHKKIVPAEEEILSDVNKINEYIMTSLRTMWGMNLNKIQEEFGSDYRKKIEETIEEFIDKDHINNQEGIVTLTTEGKLLADKISSDLFVEELD
jgi:oxygen-independent coproporphyrinogen-3 oxidase